MAKQRYSKSQIRKALHDNNGLETYAAKQLGCTYKTIRNYINRYPELAEEVFALRCKVSDIAQNNIMVAINNGDIDISKWWLGHMRKELFGAHASLDVKSVVSVSEVPKSQKAIELSVEYTKALLHDNKDS